MSEQTDFISSSWIHFPGEPIGTASDGTNRTDGHRLRVFEESVTFIAQLQTDDDDMVPPIDPSWMVGPWRIPRYQIPVIIGVSSGVVLLVTFIAIFIIWRCCCRVHKLDEKAYAMHKGVEDGRIPVVTSPSSNSSTSSFPSLSMPPSPSLKTASPCLSTVARQQHYQLAKSNTCELIRLTASHTPTTVNGKRRAARAAGPENDELQEGDATLRSCNDMSMVGYGCYVGFDLPDCPESTGNASSCASNSVVDVPWVGNGFLSDEPELRTRSLPAWARNKGVRAVQSVDLLAPKEPAGKGSRSVAPTKRSVLRHDAAALIALSKTQQQSTTGPLDVDRVSLVGRNQAVIIFNERTAL